MTDTTDTHKAELNCGHQLDVPVTKTEGQVRCPACSDEKGKTVRPRIKQIVADAEVTDAAASVTDPSEDDNPEPDTEPPADLQLKGSLTEDAADRPAADLAADVEEQLAPPTDPHELMVWIAAKHLAGPDMGVDLAKAIAKTGEGHADTLRPIGDPDKAAAQWRELKAWAKRVRFGGGGDERDVPDFSGLVTLNTTSKAERKRARTSGNGTGTRTRPPTTGRNLKEIILLAAAASDGGTVTIGDLAKKHNVSRGALQNRWAADNNSGVRSITDDAGRKAFRAVQD